MAGFQNINQIINALTVNGKGQVEFWTKTGPTTVAAGNYSLWRAAGLPTVGADPASLNDTNCDSTTIGAMSFTNPTSPATLHLINSWATSPTVGSTGTLLLVDRLMGYGNINANVNTLQSFTNDGAIPRYTTGDGVMMFLEVTTALGATASNATIIYTNQAGTGSKSTGAQTMVVSSIANRIPTAFQFFPLASGDSGVRSVQSIQFSAAMLAGVANLVLCRPLMAIPLALVGVAGQVDMTVQMPMLPQIKDGACLQWIFIAPAASTTPVFSGQINVAEN